MKIHKKYFPFLLCFLLLPLPTQGQWPTTIDQQLEIAVNPLTDDNFNERAIPYPDGNTLLIWNEEIGADFDLILYQIVDRYGEFIFPQAQCLVDSSWLTGQIKTIPDANGGAIILFNRDVYNISDWVYVQKLDEFGTKIWGDTGILIASALTPGGTGCAFGYEIVQDTTINDIFVFFLYGSPTNLMAQKFNSEGIPIWPGIGVIVADSGSFGFRYFHNSIAPDMNGGVYAVWSGDIGGITKVYMQHLDTNGNRLWGDPHWGLLLHNCGGYSWNTPEMMPDGEGGVIIFDLDDIQRVNSAGNIMWSLDDPTGGWGLATFFHPGNNHDFYITTSNGDENSSIIRAWRVSLDGQFLWPGYHIEITNYLASIGQWCYGAFFKDNHLFVSFVKYGNGGRYIISQKVDSSGNQLWGLEGVITARFPLALDIFRSSCTDQEDGLITLFFTYNTHLYGKRVRWNGTLGGSLPAIDDLIIAIENNNAILSWPSIPEASTYNIYESSFPNFSPQTLIVTTQDTNFIDQGAVLEGEKFYRVTWER